MYRSVTQQTPELATTSRRTRLRRRHAWTASLAATFALMPLFLIQVDGQSLRSTLEGLRHDWVAAGCLAGLLYQALRALRFGALMHARWSVGLTATMCLHGVARKILPVWVGEAAGVWMFRRRHGVSYGRGTASIVMARMLDLSLVAGAALVLVLVLGLPGALPGWAGWTFGALVATGVALLSVVGRLDRWLAGVSVARRPLVVLHRFTSELAIAVREGTTVGVLLPAAGASLLMWIAMYLQHYSFIVALGFPLSATDVLWIQILLVPIQLLPVRGLADLGTHEAGWFVGAALVGLSGTAAAELAIGTHLLAFVAAGVYMMAATAVMTAERLCRDGRTRARGRT